MPTTLVAPPVKRWRVDMVSWSLSSFSPSPFLGIAGHSQVLFFPSGYKYGLKYY